MKALGWVAVSTAGLFALTGCGGTDSCWGLEVGNTYTFTVQEFRPPRAQQPSAPRCDPSLPPAIGDTFEFRVVNKERAGRARDCYKALGELQGGQHALRIVEGQVYYGAVPFSAGTDQVIQASAFIDWNDCRGTWGIQAAGQTADHNAFVAYRPGNPAVVLYRGFYPEAFLTPEAVPAGCGFCVDHFGVEVSK